MSGACWFGCSGEGETEAVGLEVRREARGAVGDVVPRVQTNSLNGITTIHTPVSACVPVLSFAR